ncbi:MAG TPA: menaquinone biosynthesis protein [Saprospiraceae bacterium]|nr:menaquinone biosynthesis protein [Saprospiraceae bacterium]
MKKIKVTAVSYLNTKPLLYGLVHHPVFEKIELQTDIPSLCADRLIHDEVDLALIPVAAIPNIKNPQIISDYCIGTQGTVKTVCIYAEQPIETLSTIYLDHHSRTSVKLAQLLLEKHWHLNPKLLTGQEGYIDQIKEDTGGLVIGDRTIGLEKRFSYTYDLGEAWASYTDGLPFVFAAWVSNKPLPASFIEEFNEALKYGLDHIPKLMYLLPTPGQNFSLEEYFTKYIKYELDNGKREALRQFLYYLKADYPLSLKESLSPI